MNRWNPGYFQAPRPARAALFLLLIMSLPEPGRTQGVTRDIILMGTHCSLTIFASGRASSVDQLELLIRALEDAELELSTWREGSRLSALNRQPVGISFHAEPALCRLFSELLYWHAETGGAFDPGIGRLLEAWGVRSEGRIPSGLELREARLRSGMRRYTADVSSCRITRLQDVLLDCGAFGKGEALDRLRSASRLRGIDSWIVNLGGQIAAQGSPPGTDGWDVSIAHPMRRGEPALKIFMNSGSLATSGGSERDLEVENRRVSHILDARTGYPVTFAGSVSVWHEKALIADILSTALYVMGPKEGLPWAESRNLAVCYLTAPGGIIKVAASSAFDGRFVALRN